MGSSFSNCPKTVARAETETLFHQCAPVATGRDFLGTPETSLQHGESQSLRAIDL